MNEKFFTYNGLNFRLKQYSEEDALKLLEYCETCGNEGVPNNSSLKYLKMNRWSNDRWWVVYNLEKNIIVSVSGAHPLLEYASDCWRIMFRLGTIKEFRGKAGPMYKDQRSCFGWGHMLPFQIEFCKSMGAKKIVFTTNCDNMGDLNSQKQDKICNLVFERLGMAKKIDQLVLYNTTQNVWEVLVEDVISKTPLHLAQ